MKTLMIVAGLCAVLGGCAGPAAAEGVWLVSAELDQGAAFALGRDCAVWQSAEGLEVCAGDHDVIQAAAAAEVPALAPEQPAEVVGEEAHHLVLEGRS